MRYKIHVTAALDFEGTGHDESEYVKRSLGYAAALSLGKRFHLVSGLPLLAHKIACDIQQFEIQLEKEYEKQTN